MRIAVVTSVIAAALASPVLAQNETPVPPEAQAVGTDAQSVRKAENVLRESAKTYASAKAMTDTVTFAAKTPQGDQAQSMTIAFQGADAARIVMDDMTYTAINNALYVEREGIADKYAQFPIEGGLADTLRSEIGMAPPHFVVRSTDDVQRIINAWTFEMLPGTTIAGFDSGKSDAGGEAYQIKLNSGQGTGVVHVNVKSMLVDKVTMHVKPEGAPTDFEMDVTLTFQPKTLDALSPAIAFDAGTRTKVSSVDELKIDLTGKPAPDFTLEALDGSKVTLSELKGNVVILDFWATWCGPCKMALPKVNEFAQWARENNPKVKVYCVDVWERSKPEETKKAVAEFWTSKGYTMPTLLDLDSAVAKKYGFDSIPTTIIVGTDGNVFAVHTGYNDDIVAELKKSVEEAMKPASE